VGLLEAYARKQESLKNVSFRETIFLRTSISTVVENLEGANVLAISCYLWNWNWSLELAREAKKRHPGIVVVLGGPQVPQENKNFLVENRFVDVLVFNEGEQVFADLLVQFSSENVELGNIKGISFMQDGKVMTTSPQDKINDLSLIESPYLSGIFDEIVEQYDLQFQVYRAQRLYPNIERYPRWKMPKRSQIARRR
jgi:putative methyltransferase